jgi:hypothetical protein
MADYRAYIVGERGEFIRSLVLLCPDEEIAKEYAKQLAHGHDVELWQQDCRVTVFSHKPE